MKIIASLQNGSDSIQNRKYTELTPTSLLEISWKSALKNMNYRFLFDSLEVFVTEYRENLNSNHSSVILECLQIFSEPEEKSNTFI